MSPWSDVMKKWKAGQLKSGGSGGPAVKNQKQAVAIMLSEKRKAATNPEYAAPAKSTRESVPGLKHTEYHLQQARKDSIAHIKRGR